MEEPFNIAVTRILKLYSNATSDPQLLKGGSFYPTFAAQTRCNHGRFTNVCVVDLAESSSRCYLPHNDQEVPKELLSCLDYSLTSDQVLALQYQTSVFGNEEICT